MRGIYSQFEHKGRAQSTSELSEIETLHDCKLMMKCPGCWASCGIRVSVVIFFYGSQRVGWTGWGSFISGEKGNIFEFGWMRCARELPILYILYFYYNICIYYKEYGWTKIYRDPSTFQQRKILYYTLILFTFIRYAYHKVCWWKKRFFKKLFNIALRIFLY